jgi:hypothetical protein
MSNTESRLDPDTERWLAIRKAEASKIDPHTAETMDDYLDVLDPYGIRENCRSEERRYGIVFFARNPGSDVWVAFQDLPELARDVMWRRIKAEFLNEAIPDGSALEALADLEEGMILLTAWRRSN